MPRPVKRQDTATPSYDNPVFSYPYDHGAFITGGPDFSDLELAAETDKACREYGYSESFIKALISGAPRSGGLDDDPARRRRGTMRFPGSTAMSGDVVAAMRRWLDGEPVPTLNQFCAEYGEVFRDWLYLISSAVDSDWLEPPSSAEAALARSQRFKKRMDASIGLISQRQTFVREFGFAIPCKEALDALAELEPLLEIGAGTGAWTKLLANAGADVIATDPATGYGHLFKHARWYFMEILDAEAAVERWPVRNVFCSWPSLVVDGDPDADRWLLAAARKMRSGRSLAVIREEATADQETWDYIEGAFESIRSVRIPQWYGIHDRLEIWRKP